MATLSRLNRTAPGKERTYILDFQNEIEDIQLAFKPFYEAAALEETSDPNQIYELDAKLKTFGILDNDEIERFAAIFYKGPLDPSDRIRLEGLVRHAVQRFELEDDEGRQEEFRQLLKSYMRFYSFVAQVVNLGDTRPGETLFLCRLADPAPAQSGSASRHRDHRKHDATARLQDRAEGGRQRLTRGGRYYAALTDQEVRRETIHGRRGKIAF